jgi:hypothetical protein
MNPNHSQQKSDLHNTIAGQISSHSDLDLRTVHFHEQISSEQTKYVRPAPASDSSMPLEESLSLATFYHDCVATKLSSIFRFGFYLSSSYATLSPKVCDYGNPSVSELMVTFALRLPNNDMTHCLFGAFPKRIEGSPVRLPLELKAHLKLYDCFYLRSDESYSTSRKQRTFRDEVKGAHKLLGEERKGALVHYDLRTIDIGQTLQINQNKPHYPALVKYLNEISQNGGQTIQIEESDAVQQNIRHLQRIAPFYKLFRWVDYLIPRQYQVGG